MNYHTTTLQVFRFPRVEQNNATMNVNASIGFLEIQVSEALLVPRVHSLITAMVSRKQVSACAVLGTRPGAASRAPHTAANTDGAPFPGLLPRTGGAAPRASPGLPNRMGGVAHIAGQLLAFWGVALGSEEYPPRAAPGVGAELSPRHRVHPPTGHYTVGDRTAQSRDGMFSSVRPRAHRVSPATRPAYHSRR